MESSRDVYRAMLREDDHDRRTALRRRFVKLVHREAKHRVRAIQRDAEALRAEVGQTTDEDGGW